MRSLLPLCTALLGTALAASTAAAQVPFIPPPPAPDLCSGGGFYAVASVDTATTVQLRNLGYPGNASPGGACSRW